MILKRIKDFTLKENLSYSGEDVTKMPVIGRVITKINTDIENIFRYSLYAPPVVQIVDYCDGIIS